MRRHAEQATIQLFDAARPAVQRSTGQLGTAAGLGAIVPHAGWICSGAVAAESILALAGQRPRVDVVVVFGAIHTAIRHASDRSRDFRYARAWAMPGGDSTVTVPCGTNCRGGRSFFVTDDRFHQREHAVEVELPLIQAAWPEAKILPVEVPPEPGRLKSE